MASDTHSQPAAHAASAAAFTPIPAADRVFSFRDHMALWFSLGVGLLVMQIGAYLVPAVGTRDAVLAIVLVRCSARACSAGPRASATKAGSPAPGSCMPDLRQRLCALAGVC